MEDTKSFITSFSTNNTIFYSSTTKKEEILPCRDGWHCARRNKPGPEKKKVNGVSYRKHLKVRLVESVWCSWGPWKAEGEH